MCVRSIRPHTLAVFFVGLVGSIACERNAASSSPTVTPQAAAEPAACPACECQCDCEGQSGEIRDLTRSATRKVAHRDASCMEDLNRIRTLDRRTDSDLTYLRGQCEMVAGHCQAGKARIIAMVRDQQGLGPDMALRTADAMAGMYCRGGDADDRDRLLGVLHELNDGAYMNRRSPEFCHASIDLARKLIPRVKPRDRNDHQIASAKDTVYITGATCLAHAGDCKGARRVFEQLFPPSRLAAIPAAQRPTVLRTSFESIVSECK